MILWCNTFYSNPKFLLIGLWSFLKSASFLLTLQTLIQTVFQPKFLIITPTYGESRIIIALTRPWKQQIFLPPTLLIVNYRFDYATNKFNFEKEMQALSPKKNYKVHPLLKERLPLQKYMQTSIPKLNLLVQKKVDFIKETEGIIEPYRSYS